MKSTIKKYIKKKNNTRKKRGGLNVKDSLKRNFSLFTGVHGATSKKLEAAFQTRGIAAFTSQGDANRFKTKINASKPSENLKVYSKMFKVFVIHDKKGNILNREGYTIINTMQGNPSEQDMTPVVMGYPVQQQMPMYPEQQMPMYPQQQMMPLQQNPKNVRRR